MKKILSTILVLSMLLSLLAMPALAADPLELTMFFPVNVGGSVAQLIDDMTTEFNKQNPDIQVKAVYTGNYDDTVTAIQTAIGVRPARSVCEPGYPALHHGRHRHGHGVGRYHRQRSRRPGVRG